MIVPASSREQDVLAVLSTKGISPSQVSEYFVLPGQNELPLLFHL